MSIHEFVNGVTIATACYAHWYHGIARVIVPESAPQAHLDRVLHLSQSNGLGIADIDPIDGPFMAELSFYPVDAIDIARDGDAK